MCSCCRACMRALYRQPICFLDLCRKVCSTEPSGKPEHRWKWQQSQGDRHIPINLALLLCHWCSGLAAWSCAWSWYPFPWQTYRSRETDLYHCTNPIIHVVHRQGSSRQSSKNYAPVSKFSWLLGFFGAAALSLARFTSPWRRDSWIGRWRSSSGPSTSIHWNYSLVPVRLFT